MSIALVGSWISAISSSATTLTLSKTGTVAGNMLVLTASSFAATFTSVKDGAGNNFTLAATHAPAVSSTIFVYYLPNIAGGNVTVTITIGFNTSTSASLAEFSGCDQLSPFDKSAVAEQSNVTIWTSGNITPANAGELAIGVNTHSGTTTTTATTGSGYTAIIATENNSIDSGLATEWQVLSGAPSIAALFTTAALDSGGTMIALFTPPFAVNSRLPSIASIFIHTDGISWKAQ